MPYCFAMERARPEARTRSSDEALVVLVACESGVEVFIGVWAEESRFLDSSVDEVTVAPFERCESVFWAAGSPTMATTVPIGTVSPGCTKIFVKTPSSYDSR